jgi:NAD+ synthase
MTTRNFKIAVAQINPVVGDLTNNFYMITSAYEKARAGGADLVVTPECALTGYPLEDLVLRESFMKAVVAKLEELHAYVLAEGKNAPTLIVGTPFPHEGGVQNIALVMDPNVPSVQYNVGRFGSDAEINLKTLAGRKLQSAVKYELPNYGVFDEQRTFKRGGKTRCIEWRGIRLGLMICEDAWFPKVAHDLYKDDACYLISINGSPFEIGKNVTRHDIVAKRIKETGLPFLYVNLVGGQDELVFDGGSFLYDGNSVQQAPYFEDGVFIFETIFNNERAEHAMLSMSWGDPPPDDLATLDNYPKIEPTGLAEIYRAIVLGTGDYMRKQNFKSVVLGYSGGVDSGLVAALACDVLGPEQVHLVRLPSGFSSQHSLDDASSGAARLGANIRTIPIEPVVNALRTAYSTMRFGNAILNPMLQLSGVADENIQARARGVILMSISNQEHHLLLTTGNKSEVSVGYSTLYGDMSGGFNPIKDCYKVLVWQLCRWRNSLTADQILEYGFKGRATEVVPEEIIVKPPSAELRPDQKDEDSLPPYPVLDALLEGMIEQEKSVSELVDELGLEIDTVMRIRNLVDGAEYKRRQAAPGVKLTPKIHGRDRRYPIVNRWRG